MIKVKIYGSSYPLGEDDDVKEVSKVVIVSPEGEVLLVRRASHMMWHPDKWDLPGGHWKKGENGSSAAIRELKEELGIDIGDLEETDKAGFITVFKTNIEKQDHYDLDDENQEAKWVSVDALKDLDVVPNIQKYIVDAL